MSPAAGTDFRAPWPTSPINSVPACHGTLKKYRDRAATGAYGKNGLAEEGRIPRRIRRVPVMTHRQQKKGPAMAADRNMGRAGPNRIMGRRRWFWNTLISPFRNGNLICRRYATLLPARRSCGLRPALSGIARGPLSDRGIIGLAALPFPVVPGGPRVVPTGGLSIRRDMANGVLWEGEKAVAGIVFLITDLLQPGL